MFRMILSWVGSFLLQVILDSASKKVIYHAIKKAEESGKKGQDKMKVALEFVKQEGTQSLKNTTESKLRTLLENAIDRIKI